MIEQIYNEYGLMLSPVTYNGGEWLSSGDQLFCFVDQMSFHHSDIREVSYFCSQLIQRGHDRIATIVPTKAGGFHTKYNGQQYVLLAFPKNRNEAPPSSEALAYFHMSGQELFKQMGNSRGLYPNWREFWAKRIDELSSHWMEVEQKENRTEYEELFLKVFPYYSGRAENAIQYLTDLLIDVQITDHPAICHHRFNRNSWGRSTLFVNTPDQWVIDHPARDIAEWIRSEIMSGSRGDLRAFIDAYQRENKLSTEGLGLVFARILYPLRFIENAELVFDREGDDSQALAWLKDMLSRVDDEERFLAEFGKTYLKPLPRVDWLARKLKASL